ncbi:MAG: hypothetical protein Q8P67_23045, partial [archaeon]|nr:hypothetical protein [archaeon]
AASQDSSSAAATPPSLSKWLSKSTSNILGRNRQAPESQYDLLTGLTHEVVGRRRNSKPLPLCLVPLKTGSLDEARMFLRSFRYNLNTLRRIDNWMCLFSDTLNRECRSPVLSPRVINKIQSRLLTVSRGAVQLLLSSNPIYNNSQKFNQSFKSELHQSIENYMIATLSQPILSIYHRLYSADDREIDSTLHLLQQHPFVEELGLLDQYTSSTTPSTPRSVQDLVRIEMFLKSELSDAISEMGVVALCRTPMQILLRFKTVADSITTAINRIRRRLPSFLRSEIESQDRRTDSPLSSFSPSTVSSEDGALSPRTTINDLSSTTTTAVVGSPVSSVFGPSAAVGVVGSSPTVDVVGSSPIFAAAVDSFAAHVEGVAGELSGTSPTSSLTDLESPQPMATSHLTIALKSPEHSHGSDSVNEDVTTDDLLSHLIAVMAWSRPPNLVSTLEFIDLHVGESFMYSELGFLQTTLYATRTFLKEQQYALRNGRKIAFVPEAEAAASPMPSPLSPSSDSPIILPDPEKTSHQLFMWGCIPEVCHTPRLAHCLNDEPLLTAECIEKSMLVVLQSGKLLLSDVFQSFGGTTNRHLEAPCSYFAPIPGLMDTKIRLVAGSDTHVICVANDERSFVWGQNDYGQLGLGDTTDHSTPQLNPVIGAIMKRVDSYASIREIACGNSFSVMLSTSGHVFTWGRGEHGRLGLGEDDNHNKAIPFLVQGPLQQQLVVRIACGSLHTLCLTDTGQVFSFGSNASGQLGVSSNEALSCAMAPTAIPFFEGRFVKAISAGFGHSAALVDSELYTWGWGETGQLGHGTFESVPLPKLVEFSCPVRPVLLSCGGSHTAMLSYDGVVFVWGSNRFGQLGIEGTDCPHPRPISGLLLPFHIEHISCGFWQTIAFGSVRREAPPLLTPTPSSSTLP